MPKNNPICSTVSREHWLVIDTDKHRHNAIASTRTSKASGGYKRLTAYFLIVTISDLFAARGCCAQTCNTDVQLLHPFNGPLSGLPRWASTRNIKLIWIILKQDRVSGSGISWAVCKSAPCSRQITTPAPHHSVFYRPDALPATQPTASKHWRDCNYKCNRTEKRNAISHG